MKEAVELSGLGPRIDDKIKTYSKGMRRRPVVAALLREIAQIASLQ
jgi:ABC-2 type transport system ATP-binding protein